ncbi:MAG: hypothetical protein UHJ11_04675 [Paludibacteraceae bacterium]|jgi:flagellar motor protein MotB|nr:hypothetical protein [Paludibacteraceae bacterium]
MAKKESFFWTSYSDLMTSMFFVMLVLFVLVVALLHKKITDIDAERKATEQQLRKITELNESIEQIDAEYFMYDQTYKRHTLKNVSVEFDTQSSDIMDINEDDRIRLLSAGHAIRNFMLSAKEKLPEAEYLLIIEGQSSKDNYSKNYELSYSRALALVKYWTRNGIRFDDLPCEVIISGSGQASRFRVRPEVKNGKANSANQRFVIHIIPKPGIMN